MKTKEYISVLIAGVIAGIVSAFIVLVFAPQPEAVGSPSGTTFTTAKVAQININPQSITSTSTSLLNSDSYDRIVTDAFVSCSGLGSMYGTDGLAGVAAFQWYMGTSSTAAPIPSLAARTFLAGNFTVATSSTDGYTATSTYTGTAVFGRRWNSGSYLVIQTNATSSTATCTAGVHYLGS